MIGRLLRAAIVVASLHAFPAAAAWASSPVTNVTWHRGGLLTWEQLERKAIRPPTVYRASPGLAPGRFKVIAAGRPGLAQVRVRFAQRGGGPVRRRVLWIRVIRPAKPRVVAGGIGSTPLWAFEARGVRAMAYMARSAIEMLATAYTAQCSGCDGMTAIGRRAGHGIVAVDPRVIPLGTRLFIPGYGPAIAGDTGGDIVGNRIDLGFDSMRDAMRFGRRTITVYRLK